MDLDEICVKKSLGVLYDFVYLYNPQHLCAPHMFIVNYKNM